MTETINIIVNLIGNIGFPAVMCLIMTYYFNTSLKDLEKTVDNLNDAVNKICDKLTI